MDTAEFEAICLLVFDYRYKIDQLKLEIKSNQESLSELEHKVITHLEVLGKKTHACALGTLSRKVRFSYKVPKEPGQREAFFAYLKEKQVFEGLITVHANTLNAFCDAEINAAVNRGDSDFVVPGLGEPTSYTTLAARKS